MRPFIGGLVGTDHQVLRRRVGGRTAPLRGRIALTGHDRTEALAARFREAFSRFDRYAGQAFASAFGCVAHFVAQHRMKVRISNVVPGRRSFQFALPDGSRVTISFIIEGIDQLDSTSEYWIRSTGPSEGARSTTSLRDADRRWGEAYLLMALEGFGRRWVENRSQVLASQQQVASGHTPQD